MAKSNGDELVGFLSFVVFVVIIGMSAKYMGWVDGAALISGLTILGGLVGLILVVKLPWDLYFDAQILLHEQQESIKKGLKVDDDNIKFAKSTARRALLLSVAIHLFSSLGIAIYTFYSGEGNLGYLFSGAYLLSMFLRPIAAFYKHQKIRLAQLRQQCTFPRDDVWELKASVENVVATHQQMTESVRQLTASVDALQQAQSSDRNHANNELKQLSRKLDDHTERMGREFEKAIEQLTEDKEVLRGLRAIVKLIKES